MLQIYVQEKFKKCYDLIQKQMLYL